MGISKVAWFSNKSILERDPAGTGSWLSPLADKLAKSGEIEICNIVQSNVDIPQRKGTIPLQEWTIPRVSQAYYRKGQLPRHFVEQAAQIIKEFSPDLIHVWGTENIAGLLTARKIIQCPALLDMQGLKLAYSRVFAADLTFREQLACIGLKEIIRRSTISAKRAEFAQWGMFEKEIVSGHAAITVQTNWMEGQITNITSPNQLFYSDHYILREPFYKAAPWKSQDNATIFCLISDTSPYKGLHVAVRMLAALTKKFSHVQLHVGGALQRKGPRNEGYITWVNRQAEKLGVSSHIIWLGQLTATQVIQNMQSSAVMLLPTFIENCPLTVQEALYVGIPLVTSYVGGIPSLVTDEQTALFFSPGDAVMAAYQIQRVLTNHALAERLSKNGREVSLKRNDADSILQRQLSIYQQVISNLPQPSQQ